MIKVEWANSEKNIVIWTFLLNWTWDDFHDAKRQVDAMIDDVEGIVDSIFLTTNVQHIPANAVSNFGTIAKKRHQRHDLIVVVGSRSFIKSLVNVTFALVPGLRRQIYFVTTIDEAYEIIGKAQRQRASYP